MKKIYLLFLFILLNSFAYAIGVGVVDAQWPKYLKTDSSFVNVKVEGQISVTTSLQVFTNNTNASVIVKFAFPLPEQASPTSLRYRINNEWKSAIIAGNQQDTTLPGGTVYVHPDLKNYLGAGGLYFPIPGTIAANSKLAVEITYVEFLPYKLGQVSYIYPADYHLIQKEPLAALDFNFNINSQRSIDSLVVLSSQPVMQLINSGYSGQVKISQQNTAPVDNYKLKYILNSNQLGLFAYSNLIPDSLTPDKNGGVFSFIAEPNAKQVSYIKKYFTLIIDRSGSMAGTKMDQAKNAASFIINNLNEGDMFNLVGFDDQIDTFKSSHVPYTSVNKNDALNFIKTLYARSGTNIGAAFAAALPQFSKASDSTANIIIFLTDGQPTVGITNIYNLVPYIDSLISTTVKKVYLYNFGIGGDVNYQLLSIMANNNRGLAQFLGNYELYSAITDFYLTIKNPVLLNTSVTFSPNNVFEVYPDTLQNLYKGQQLIIAGRYKTPGNVKITLSGLEYSKLMTYTYNIQLSDSNSANNSFLIKVWAKKKIETLMTRYYMLNPYSSSADSLKKIIIGISKTFSVVCPLTSFDVPVEMVSFSGRMTPLGIELNWVTATELNNLGFTIERKMDNGEFIEIGFKKGKGNTTEVQYYSFIDKPFQQGRYSYRLKQMDYDGQYKYSKVVTVDFVTGSYTLDQNYPNPFNPVTTIKYTIPQDGLVKLEIYNIIGQKVAVLENSYKKAGIYEVEFRGDKLASGIYCYRLECGNFVASKKMMILK